MSAPLLSVIVPAHQAAAQLPVALEALGRSDFPRSQWQLIVVDDASTDETAAIAMQSGTDDVVSLPAPKHGPAFARNRGAEICTGEWLVFVDADVAVHANTLSRLAAIIEAEPDVDGIFGAYDDSPAACGFLSQYRNLRHRYLHLRSEGEAATFWAGCGAVRRSAFVAAGGFDEVRYDRPQIEDIELGYRLRERGSRIVLRPEVQATHLKRWTFRDAVRVDVWDRGVPWVRLLLERGELASASTLNIERGERSKTVAVSAALVLLLAALSWPSRWLAVIAFLLLAAVAIANHPQIVWFSKRRGARFAMLVVPMHLWYYVISALSVMLGVGLHVVQRRSVAIRI